MAKFGLIGFPLTHSFSKKFFTEKFENEKIDSSYESFEIEEVGFFAEIIKNTPGLIGLNVTIPYKQQVIPFLDEIDEAAKEVGAVNTIKISRHGGKIFLKGFNSDTFGFEATISPLLKSHHTKALILGTGGASKAIKYVLKNLGIDFISASIEELQEDEIRYEDIDAQIMAERTIIINATPLGTYPKIDNCPSIPYEEITPGHLLFDLVYNPEETKFLRLGKEKGAAIKNGYDMLIHQALKSYEYWNQ